MVYFVIFANVRGALLALCRIQSCNIGVKRLDGISGGHHIT